MLSSGLLRVALKRRLTPDTLESDVVLAQDTIVAIATPAGKGGVGIVRLSGKDALTIGERLTQSALKPRYAHFTGFFENASSTTDNLLDEGIVIYFKAPHSFTGEDVVELQGHGGPVLLDAIVRECIQQGARMANPGEFSERAFLNDKLDLAQAEAIADLIDSSSLEAAKNALRSLQGAFSSHIHQLVEQVTHLRVFVEAAIDFPEEEIDFITDGRVSEQLSGIKQQLASTLESARQGSILREGMTVVIAGRPNAGKSSLLNALAGHDAAIVTDIAGTTRDVLKEQIHIDGMPLHIIDTAGLRESADIVEQEGIRRAWQAIEQADAILLVNDSTTTDMTLPASEIWPAFTQRLPSLDHLTVIHNKCDLSEVQASMDNHDGVPVIKLSAKAGDGLPLLTNHLKAIAGLNQQAEGGFTARRRHLDALERAMRYLDAGELQLNNLGAGELLAEDLRYCQQCLSEITGEFSSDDLLGEIFSSFCIGK
ncbi:tRNA modification GTPase MnmE [BD1-7 clade bacterium]|uniref:tRNA modification GTPase MnmE n=1 Tax=BD1-7 clade bacterium TaxID=2029982 RepID=A0A5S9MW09_9GAMM|nr:tRNA modification GTPase MnmE [BD1-7 clade bacterium]CAA0083213.1 tRNA modification GTPase MnmE [BD1-7 clade bacterium]